MKIHPDMPIRFWTFFNGQKCSEAPLEDSNPVPPGSPPVCLVSPEEVDEDIVVKFRIMPKYKIRSEGEKVRILDQITLMPFGWEDTRCVSPLLAHAPCLRIPRGK